MMRRAVFIAIGSFFLLAALLGALIVWGVPYAIKNVLPKVVAKETNATLEIKEARLSFRPLTVYLGGISLSEPNGKKEFLRLDSAEVQPNLYSAVKLAVVIDKTKLSGLSLRVSSDGNGSFNFQKFLKTERMDGKATAKPLLFWLSDTTIKNAKLHYLDAKSGKALLVENIALTVPFLSNFEDKKEHFTAASLSFDTIGANVSINANLKPFAKRTSGEIDLQIKNLSVRSLLAYLAADTQEVKADAMVDARAKLLFFQDQNKTFSVVVQSDGTADRVELSKSAIAANASQISWSALDFSYPNLRLGLGGLKLHGLSLKTQNEELLRVGTIGLERLNASLEDRAAHIGKIYADAAVLKLKRASDGNISAIRSLMAIFPKGEEKKPQKPFSYEINETVLNDSTVEWSDEGGKKAYNVAFSGLSLHAGKISSDESVAVPIKLSATMQRKASLNIEGEITQKPLFAQLSLRGSKIPLKLAQEIVQLHPRIAIDDGSAAIDGKLLFGQQDKEYAGSFKGGVFVKNFNTVDTQSKQSIFSFETLNLEGIDIDSLKRNAFVNALALSGFSTKLLIDKNGTLNISSYLSKEENASAKQPSKPWQTAIKRITLQGGEIEFSDEHVLPAYKASLHEITGRVSSLYPNRPIASSIELMGHLGSYGKININGFVIPSGEKFELNLTSSCADIAMPPFTPYSGKFLGYKIASGSLQLDLAYAIVGKQLNASNKITLKSLDFGEEVDSKDAVRLPIRFAVAVLKDKNGDIALDLPVEGSTDNPEIRSGRVVWKLILSILKKIVTAPFALLGSIFGGGEELGYVEFGYGLAALDEKSAMKLDTIAKILTQKPSLSLELQGFMDEKSDLQALRKMEFDSKITAQMPQQDLNETASGEYEKYLKKAYDAQKFPKPKNILGLDKTLSAQEMEKLIMTNIVLGEKELSHLVERRVDSIRDFFAKKYPAILPRISISVTKAGVAEKKENLKNSRVELKLK